jgi:hypothetical protein
MFKLLDVAWHRKPWTKWEAKRTLSKVKPFSRRNIDMTHISISEGACGYLMGAIRILQGFAQWRSFQPMRTGGQHEAELSSDIIPLLGQIEAGQDSRQSAVAPLLYKGSLFQSYLASTQQQTQIELK